MAFGAYAETVEWWLTLRVSPTDVIPKFVSFPLMILLIGMPDPLFASPAFELLTLPTLLFTCTVDIAGVKRFGNIDAVENSFSYYWLRSLLPYVTMGSECYETRVPAPPLSFGILSLFLDWFIEDCTARASFGEPSPMYEILTFCVWSSSSAVLSNANFGGFY